MDQVEAELTEEQLAEEPASGLFLFARLFRELSRLLLGRHPRLRGAHRPLPSLTSMRVAERVGGRFGIQMRNGIRIHYPSSVLPVNNAAARRMACGPACDAPGRLRQRQVTSGGRFVDI
ncbi:MAG: hypothetical protein U0802_12515 [Candidatus Binatia bacterium]